MKGQGVLVSNVQYQCSHAHRHVPTNVCRDLVSWFLFSLSIISFLHFHPTMGRCTNKQNLDWKFVLVRFVSD